MICFRANEKEIQLVYYKEEKWNSHPLSKEKINIGEKMPVKRRKKIRKSKTYHVYSGVLKKVVLIHAAWYDIGMAHRTVL